MLRALRANGERILAEDAARSDMAFCPECRVRLTLKAGTIVVKHFAHQGRSECPCTEGETTRHLQMKAWMRDVAETCFIDYELPIIVGHRADVVLTEDVIVECQASAISIEEWRRRTRAYNAKGYAVLWLWDIRRLGWSGRFVPAMADIEVRIPAEIRYCHQVSFGRIYVMDDTGDIRACHLARAQVRYREGGPSWDDSVYTPHTLKRILTREPSGDVTRMRGANGETLVNMGDGIWWKATEDAS